MKRPRLSAPIHSLTTLSSSKCMMVTAHSSTARPVGARPCIPCGTGRCSQRPGVNDQALFGVKTQFVSSLGGRVGAWKWLIRDTNVECRANWLPALIGTPFQEASFRRSGPHQFVGGEVRRFRRCFILPIGGEGRHHPPTHTGPTVIGGVRSKV